MQPDQGYRIVRLANGTFSVHCLDCRETFHPVIGPAAEAECLYVRQLDLARRMRHLGGDLVVWDVGLGAAANAIAAIRATRQNAGCLRLFSFDHSLGPLSFGLSNAALLGYFGEYEMAARCLVEQGRVQIEEGSRSVSWETVCADFPSLLSRWISARRKGPAGSKAQPLHSDSSHLPSPPAPDAILYDAYSPARNAEMWTLPLFKNLHRLLDSNRPCALATYSRSTLLRTTLLLAGFYVGTGPATGEKEETTLAASDPALIPKPLPRSWLQRARRSTSAEPLLEPHYRQAPLSPASWEQLQEHPQFRSEPH
jgi:hypothetical protein